MVVSYGQTPHIASGSISNTVLGPLNFIHGQDATIIGIQNYEYTIGGTIIGQANRFSSKNGIDSEALIM